MNSAYGNSTYGNSNLASYLIQKTLSAEPLELVVMLYLKAITEVREARRYLAEGQIALRSKAISKACAAIGELDASLNIEAGGDFSSRLRALYGYFLVRLLDANRYQSDEPLAEVLGLLSTLAEGWQSIAQNCTKPEVPLEPVSVPRWELTADGPASEMGANGGSHSWTL